MEQPVYKQVSLTEIDNLIRPIFTGTHGDQKALVYETGRTPGTISQWLSEDSERPSPIATGILLQCAMDKAFREKGDRVWQITSNIRSQMLALVQPPAGAVLDAPPDARLLAEFEQKWNELMTTAALLRLDELQKRRFFMRVRRILEHAEDRALYEREVGYVGEKPFIQIPRT